MIGSGCPHAARVLRVELTPPPARIARLPIDERGYPVPWFVAWVDGKPEFRAADGAKRVRAMRERLCWVCGEPLGVHLSFVLGPMCGVTRTTSEPPAHLECARWSVRNCPFLTRPRMVRRENDLPDHAEAPGLPLQRNPGVALIWNTRGFKVFPDHAGGWLLKVGDWESMEWYAEGRAATLEEIELSVESGLPSLREVAARESEAAVVHLEDLIRRFRRLYPVPYPADAVRR